MSGPMDGIVEASVRKGMDGGVAHERNRADILLGLYADHISDHGNGGHDQEVYLRAIADVRDVLRSDDPHTQTAVLMSALARLRGSR